MRDNRRTPRPVFLWDFDRTLFIDHTPEHLPEREIKVLEITPERFIILYMGLMVGHYATLSEALKVVEAWYNTKEQP